MPTPTNYSTFFGAIHTILLQTIKNGGCRWTQASYIENIFSWLSEFSNDLKKIKKSTSFADKAELGYMGKKYILFNKGIRREKRTADGCAQNDVSLSEDIF